MFSHPNPLLWITQSNYYNKDSADFTLILSGIYVKPQNHNLSFLTLLLN